ncbi:MAG TPA: UPF0236 family protein [Actinomycetota bacterium]|nr:UPF0236 family protein [Actinomycetota bacterium]
MAVDATGIHLVEGEGASVKRAVSSTGTKQLTGAKRRLVDRHVFADICEPDPFGQALAYELEPIYGTHRFDACLLLADGETWIKHLAGDWPPSARYQCDHWHLAVKIREFCCREEVRFRRLLERAFASPHHLAAQLASGRWKGDPDKARELAIYLTNNGDHLHTYRAMGPGEWMHGSAPAEKHIELTVNRRFKRRGMRWSRNGARRPASAGHPTGGDRHQVAVRPLPLLRPAALVVGKLDGEAGKAHHHRQPEVSLRGLHRDAPQSSRRLDGGQ